VLLGLLLRLFPGVRPGARLFLRLFLCHDTPSLLLPNNRQTTHTPTTRRRAHPLPTQRQP
jgi:hypothetical protein